MIVSHSQFIAISFILLSPDPILKIRLFVLDHQKYTQKCRSTNASPVTNPVRYDSLHHSRPSLQNTQMSETRQKRILHPPRTSIPSHFSPPLHEAPFPLYPPTLPSANPISVTPPKKHCFSRKTQVHCPTTRKFRGSRRRAAHNRGITVNRKCPFSSLLFKDPIFTPLYQEANNVQ